jgi:hypothetical protein
VEKKKKEYYIVKNNDIVSIIIKWKAKPKYYTTDINSLGYIYEWRI